MKKSIVLLIFLCFGVALKAQSKSEILPAVEKLISHSLEKDFEAILDCTYPKLFEHISADIMLEVLTASMDNEEFTIEIQPTDYDIEISNIKEIDGGKYALVLYNVKMSLRFHYFIQSEIDDFTEILNEFMPDAQVTFNRKDQSFEIFQRSGSIAISDDITNRKWKFLNISDQDKTLLKLLIDQKILNAFDL